MKTLSAITDPGFVKNEHPGALDRFFISLINDERDLPFVYLCLQIFCFVISLAVILYTPLLQGWAWNAGALLYILSVLLYFMGPFTLMLHNTSHNALFRRTNDWANNIIPWVIGPFFGQSPETYFSHHVGMHHAENNLKDDCSSTMHYQRDSLRGFMRYYLEFFFIGLIELANYFHRKKRKKLMKKVIRGEASFFVLCIALSFVNWQATLVVFIMPFILTRFAMMAGNWGQHAFIDASDSGNSYLNSITCINSGYNRKCFNDGYHIGHHLSPKMHWTDMPADFIANSAEYGRQRAIVFEGIDFFFIWLLLMLKQYKVLAKHFVNIDNVFKNDDEVVAFLKIRTQKIR
jgi:fatty acid desaturase